MMVGQADNNAITRKRNADGLSGNININTLPCLDLNAVKSMAKAKNATINDAILGGFVTAMHNTFNELGEEIPQ